MTVDNLMNWFAELGDFPELAFILAVLICAVPVFLFIAIYALVAIYGELKISSFMLVNLWPM